jgi:RimJ/RimL family protein N-acetyltransferase
MMTHWPLSGLRLTTSEVTMRWPSPEDLDGLAERGVEGVHEPGYMPFFSQWTDGDANEVSRRILQRQWNACGTWTQTDWTLYLAVVHDGTVIGSQSIGSKQFTLTREVVMTSWLGLRFQGRGLGTHARAAMLHLAFEGLSAEQVLVVVRRDNTASQRVCEKLGFVPDGVQINVVRGVAAHSDRYRLDHDRWLAHRTIDVGIHGLDKRCLAMFGMDAGALASITPPQLMNSEILSGVGYVGESDQDVS